MPHNVTLESDVELPAAVSAAAVTSLLTHVLSQEDVDEEWNLGIKFVDDTTMQAAHQEFMGVDEPTDIMTFPYADVEDEWGESEPGGDLMISVDTARENAVIAGWSLADELFFLVAHGMLHLLEWDDHSTECRTAMLDRQRVLLASWPERP